MAYGAVPIGREQVRERNRFMSRLSKVCVLLNFISAACWTQEAFGTWKMNGARSTFGPDSHAREITLRIERHAKGEMFAVDRTLATGQAATTSFILCVNGQPRGVQASA